MLECLRAWLILGMPGQFTHWVQPAWLAVTSTGAFVLYTRTPFAIQLLEQTFRTVIEPAIGEITSMPCHLEIVVASSASSVRDG